jgi:hypothetical protein
VNIKGTPQAGHGTKSPEHESAPSPVFTQNPSIDQEGRRRKVAEAAYYRAEARGFATGYELQDWLDAEAEIDRKLSPSEVRDLGI